LNTFAYNDLLKYLLPDGQLALAFSFINLRGDYISCEAKVRNFASVIIGYENISSSQVTMDNLDRELHIYKLDST